MIGNTTNNGISTELLPMKYAAVVYSLEFSSLRNTSLSAGNYTITGFNAPIKLLITKKNMTPVKLCID